MPSFFVDFEENSSELYIADEEYHHISRVFRHKEGDEITVLNGKGLIGTAKILEINKKNLKMQLIDKQFKKRVAHRIACAFSLLKNKNDLVIIEKLTELGINDLFPVETKNSVRFSKESTLEKFVKVSVTAIKQCNNPWLPNIHPVTTLEKSVPLIKMMDYKLVIASEMNPKCSLHKYLQENNESDICIVIGPEGGFDKTEFDFFNHLSLSQVSLSSNILRAETAAITAVAQISGYNQFLNSNS